MSNRPQLPDRAPTSGCVIAAVALFLFAVAACNAQKLLWRIEIHGTDTVAVGPAGDIDSAFVRWSLRGKALRECKWDLYIRDKELSSLYAERAKCDKAQEDARLLIASHAGRIEELSDHNRKLSRKVKRRTPFIPLMVGIVGGFVIHEQLGK